MDNKPTIKHKSEPPVQFTEVEYSVRSEFQLSIINEVHGIVMTVLFLVSAFMIVHYFNQTAITVLEASRLLSVFGLVAFALAFALRKSLRLSLADGLFYSVFGVAPLTLAVFFIINSSCTETSLEKHRIVSKESGGSGFTFGLENQAYEDYWHLRNISYDEASSRYGNIEFTYCEGVFGYRVIKKREMVW